MNGRALTIALVTAGALGIAKARMRRQHQRERIDRSDVRRRNSARTIRAMQRCVEHITAGRVHTPVDRSARDVFAALGFIWLNRCKLNPLARRDLGVMFSDLFSCSPNAQVHSLQTLIVNLLPTHTPVDSFVVRTLARLRDADDSERRRILATMHDMLEAA